MMIDLKLCCLGTSYKTLHGARHLFSAVDKHLPTWTLQVDFGRTIDWTALRHARFLHLSRRPALNGSSPPPRWVPLSGQQRVCPQNWFGSSQDGPRTPLPCFPFLVRLGCWTDPKHLFTRSPHGFRRLRRQRAVARRGVIPMLSCD